MWGLHDFALSRPDRFALRSSLVAHLLVHCCVGLGFFLSTGLNSCLAFACPRRRSHSPAAQSGFCLTFGCLRVLWAFVRCVPRCSVQPRIALTSASGALLRKTLFQERFPETNVHDEDPSSCDQRRHFTRWTLDATSSPSQKLTSLLAWVSLSADSNTHPSSATWVMIFFLKPLLKNSQITRSRAQKHWILQFRAPQSRILHNCRSHAPSYFFDYSHFYHSWPPAVARQSRIFAIIRSSRNSNILVFFPETHFCNF